MNYTANNNGNQEIKSIGHEYALDERTVSAVLYAVETSDQSNLKAQLNLLHPADIADLLEQISAYDRGRLLHLYGQELGGDILSELDDHLRSEIISALNPEALADAVRDLESDDVVDILEDLGESQQEIVLGALEGADRDAVEHALTYPEYTAARMMQREVVMVPQHWTVGLAIDHLRNSETLPEHFYHVVLVDARMHPVGNVPLSRVLYSPRHTLLADLTNDIFKVIPAMQMESEVAYAFNQYHLISAPVVDSEGRLIGVITIDDAMAVLDDENAQDFLRLAGVGEESLSNSVFATTKRRSLWLFVNLLTALLASLVIAQFEDEISKIVALAVLMPIVASMGGNAGTQSLTVAVRALATKDLTRSNVWRIIRREVMASFLNGMLFALLVGIVGWIWFAWPMLGVVIAVAMVVNLVLAGLAGAGIPVILQRLGIDPALAAGTFVTTVTDVGGFLAFLGLASFVLV